MRDDEMRDDGYDWVNPDNFHRIADQTVRGMAVVGWLIVLYLILSIVSLVDEHYARRMDALRQPMPARTER